MTNINSFEISSEEKKKKKKKKMLTFLQLRNT